EGAEGWYLHGAPDVPVVDGHLAGPVVVAPLGDAEDLGGALWVRDSDRLIVAPAGDAWSWREGAVWVRGVAPDAKTLVALADERVVARIPLQGDRFEAWLPPGTDGVRTEAGDRQPSPVAAPSTDLR